MKKVDRNLEKEVSEILQKLGVPAHVKGYQYLKRALILTVEDATETHSMGKLYEKVAKEFSAKSPSRVERAIRHAKELSYDRLTDNPQIFVKILGPSGEVVNGLCNSEFIATLAERIRLNMIDLAS